MTESKDKVINLSDVRFRKTEAGKIVEVCNMIDRIVANAVFEKNLSADALLVALAHRIGVFLAHTNAPIDKMSNHLAEIIFNTATEKRGI
jgi:hypothetical protein